MGIFLLINIFSKGPNMPNSVPTQAQLAEERESLKQDIQGLQDLRQEYISKGKLNAAAELEADIVKKQASEQQLKDKIDNYTTFSAERTKQDAEIQSTQNFEAKKDRKSTRLNSSHT